MIVRKKIVKKVAKKKGRSGNRSVVKKKNFNSGKKVNVVKADELFKEIIGSGESLINDLYLRLSELADSLNVIEKRSSDDCDSHELMQFIRMIKRSVEETQTKTGELQECQETLIDNKLGDYVCIPVEAESRLTDEELLKIGAGFSPHEHSSNPSAPGYWLDQAKDAYDIINQIINDREISLPGIRELAKAIGHCENIMYSIHGNCNVRGLNLPGRRIFNEKTGQWSC